LAIHDHARTAGALKLFGGRFRDRVRHDRTSLRVLEGGSLDSRTGDPAAYFLPCCRAASASIMRSSQLERAAVFLRKALSRRFNGRSDPNVHCDLALFQLRLFHSVFLDKRSDG
jgi:hypothetical protein